MNPLFQHKSNTLVKRLHDRYQTIKQFSPNSCPYVKALINLEPSLNAKF